MNNRKGVTLCSYHAKQVIHFREVPSGVCEPDSTWLNGHGETITCGFIIDPERVTAIVIKEPRHWTPARRLAETQRQSAITKPVQ